MKLYSFVLQWFFVRKSNSFITLNIVSNSSYSSFIPQNVDTEWFAGFESRISWDIKLQINNHDILQKNRPLATFKSKAPLLGKEKLAKARSASQCDTCNVLFLNPVVIWISTEIFRRLFDASFSLFQNFVHSDYISYNFLASWIFESETCFKLLWKLGYERCNMNINRKFENSWNFGCSKEV